MNTIQYLKETYGYGVPIFLKNIRIGGKSKTAIRQDLSRGVKNGDIERVKNGVYYFRGDEVISYSVTFEDIVINKFIKRTHNMNELNSEVYGYYTGETFLNKIGISQQVPAVVEITTNNTSCKRTFQHGRRRAFLRKPKVKIDRFNYKILQFLDMFHTLDDYEVEESKDILVKYITNNLSKKDLDEYIKFYPKRVLDLLTKYKLLKAFK